MENVFTPNEAVNKKIALVEEFSTLSEEIALIEQEYAQYFVLNRDSYGSDKRLEKQWESLPAGARGIVIRRRMKVIEKELSAMSSYLKNKENEAHNLY
jgi:phage regulator Rha-like protein